MSITHRSYFTVIVATLLAVSVGLPGQGSRPGLSVISHPSQASSGPAGDRLATADIIALIERAYVLAGLPDREAESVLQAYVETYGLLSGVPAPGKPLLVLPKDDPGLVVNDAMRFAGINELDRHDVMVLMGYRQSVAKNGSSVSTAGAQIITLCKVYPITLIWCEEDEHGQPITKKTFANIPEACWNDVLACPTFLVCTGSDVIWHSLTVKSGCSNLDAPIGACAYVTGEEDPVWKDCNLVNASCACFEETDPVSCSEIERTCGDPLDGPSGCPEC